MTLGQKLAKLRLLAGVARGLARELTQSEVSLGIRELGGRISQSYLSQLESGARPHLTSTSRLLLARFFGVHPGYLVDDPQHATMPIKPRHAMDDRLDCWLIEGSEEFAEDPALSGALLKIAKHENSRDCLVLFGSIVENKALIERLIDEISPAQQHKRKRRSANA
ncbi:MAG TPA: helix-turn-helix transcriptional regulator [Thermoanaerobaculia bacterium]|nr:helix-turn-helix transcriptional regulator [Thermoanaerobaculia bacterium]